MKAKAFGFVLEEKEDSNKFGSVSCFKAKNGYCDNCCYQIVTNKSSDFYSADNCLIRYLRSKNQVDREYEADKDSDSALTNLIVRNLIPFSNFIQTQLDF